MQNARRVEIYPISQRVQQMHFDDVFLADIKKNAKALEFRECDSSSREDVRISFSTFNTITSYSFKARTV